MVNCENIQSPTTSTPHWNKLFTFTTCSMTSLKQTFSFNSLGANRVAKFHFVTQFHLVDCAVIYFRNNIERRFHNQVVNLAN